MVAARRPGCVQRLLRDYDFRLGAGLRREPKRGAVKEALLKGRGLFPFFSEGFHLLTRAYYFLEGIFPDIWPHHRQRRSLAA